jgi:hypothetical protein
MNDTSRSTRYVRAGGGGLPGPAPGHPARSTLPRPGRDERAFARQRDGVAISGLRRSGAAGIDRTGRGAAGQADDVPSDVLCPRRRRRREGHHKHHRRGKRDQCGNPKDAVREASWLAPSPTTPDSPPVASTVVWSESQHTSFHTELKVFSACELRNRSSARPSVGDRARTRRRARPTTRARGVAGPRGFRADRRQLVWM